MIQTPREKYLNDSSYKVLVDTLCAHIHACHYTPSELREAAILACILYEERLVRSMSIPFTKNIEDALNKIHEWTVANGNDC